MDMTQLLNSSNKSSKKQKRGKNNRSIEDNVLNQETNNKTEEIMEENQLKQDEQNLSETQEVQEQEAVELENSDVEVQEVENTEFETSGSSEESSEQDINDKVAAEEQSVSNKPVSTRKVVADFNDESEPEPVVEDASENPIKNQLNFERVTTDLVGNAKDVIENRKRSATKKSAKESILETLRHRRNSDSKIKLTVRDQLNLRKRGYSAKDIISMRRK